MVQVLVASVRNPDQGRGRVHFNRKVEKDQADLWLLKLLRQYDPSKGNHSSSPPNTRVEFISEGWFTVFVLDPCIPSSDPAPPTTDGFCVTVASHGDPENFRDLLQVVFAFAKLHEELCSVDAVCDIISIRLNE